MAKRKFWVTLEFEVEVDEQALDRCNDDEWRKEMYHFTTHEQVAAHVGFNMVRNNIGLSSMDGFADLSDDLAKVVEPVSAEATGSS